MNQTVVLGKPILSPSPTHLFLRKSLDRLEHPSANALLTFWRDQEPKGGMRMGYDIPSRAVAKFLPHILIAEPVGDWDDARIRLAGTSLIERFGRDVAGDTASHIYAENPEGASVLLKAARRAAVDRDTGLVDLRILRDGIEVFHLETVLLPILSPDGAATWTLVGAFRF